MAEVIEAGIIKDLLGFLSKLSDKIFKYLDSADKKEINLESGKQIDDKTVEFKLKYKEKLPVTVKLESLGNGKFNMTVTVKDIDSKPKTVKNVSEDKFEKVLNDTIESLIDDDLKKSFGIKSSKKLTVKLQKITSATDIAINICAIKANYAIPEAGANLEQVLDNPEFFEAIPEEPITFDIIDIGEDLDICESDCEFDEEVTLIESIKAILCAAVQFNMEAQIAHWESAYRQDLFNITQEMLWCGRDCTDKFGMWMIERCNTVCSNPFMQDPYMWLDGCDLEPDHSPAIDRIGTAYLLNSLDTYTTILEFYYPNFPHDLQFELDSIIRNCKNMRNDVRRVNF